MSPSRNWNRRDVLKLVPALGAGAVAAACGWNEDDPAATATTQPSGTAPGTEAPPTGTSTPTQTATPSPTPTATPTPEVSLTIEEKIGEMLMIGFRGYELTATDPVGAAMSRRHLGNTVLFDYDGPAGEYGRNIQSPEQVRALTNQITELYGGPVLIAADQEGGLVARLTPRWGFPETVSAQELGDRNDLDYTRQVADEMAATLAAAGVNLNLAPVVDVNVNPDNPVIGGIGRSFSSDPELVTAHATAFIEAHHAHNVLCTLKHFPGHGSSQADSHLGFVDVTNLWTRMELEPFANLIDAGLADAIMTAHIFNEHWDPEHPATLSHAVLTGILREELGYDGVVITDDMQMGAIRDFYGFEEAVVMSIQAGADMVAIANNTVYDDAIVNRAFNALLDAVNEGSLSEARIDESVRRVQRLKQRLA